MITTRSGRCVQLAQTDLMFIGSAAWMTTTRGQRTTPNGVSAAHATPRRSGSSDE